MKKENYILYSLLQLIYLIKKILDEVNLDVTTIILEIKKNLSKLPIIKSEIKEIKIHHETNKLLNYAIFLAKENGDELVAEDYLFLAHWDPIH